MRRSTRDILFIFIGLFASIGTLWASQAAVETRLSRDVAYLNTLGKNPEGEKSLTLSLENRLRADPARISELRRERFGYGDISAALALASRMRGGMTRGNVDRVVALRRSPGFGGWGKLVRSMGVRVEKVVLQIESLRSHATGTSAAKTKPGYDPVLRLVRGG
ncbi:MAG TPA: hypothetical protein VMV03_05395 [Spirochaetia bacterium]|nr:hypothetical protein [Spirochaetia bacterium]